MRVGVCVTVFIAACKFTPPAATVDAPPVDTPIDVIDAPPSLRVQTGLVGFWTFDEPEGSDAAADTSGSSQPVPIEVVTSSSIFPPTFEGGNVTASSVSRMLSARDSRLAADCVSGGGVTLEAWVRPDAAMQGTANAPSFVTGMAGSVALRDVVLLQRGDKWLARVRTTGAADGTPDLVSTSAPDPAKLTHLVVVADATQRVLYVDDVPEATTAPGPLTGWDLSYPMALFDEPQHARFWTGTMALVALYARALSADEVHQNFEAGPDAR